MNPGKLSALLLAISAPLSANAALTAEEQRNCDTVTQAIWKTFKPEYDSKLAVMEPEIGEAKKVLNKIPADLRELIRIPRMDLAIERLQGIDGRINGKGVLKIGNWEVTVRGTRAEEDKQLEEQLKGRLPSWKERFDEKVGMGCPFVENPSIKWPGLKLASAGGAGGNACATATEVLWIGFKADYDAKVKLFGPVFNAAREKLMGIPAEHRKLIGTDRAAILYKALDASTNAYPFMSKPVARCRKDAELVFVPNANGSYSGAYFCLSAEGTSAPYYERNTMLYFSSNGTFRIRDWLNNSLTLDLTIALKQTPDEQERVLKEAFSSILPSWEKTFQASLSKDCPYVGKEKAKARGLLLGQGENASNEAVAAHLETRKAGEEGRGSSDGAARAAERAI